MLRPNPVQQKAVALPSTGATPIPAAQPGEIVQAMPNSAQTSDSIGFVSSISGAGGDSISPRSGFVHPKHSPAQIHARLPPSPGAIVQPAHNAAPGRGIGRN